MEDSIFFKSESAKILRTLPSTTYLRLSRFERGLYGQALKHYQMFRAITHGISRLVVDGVPHTII